MVHGEAELFKQLCRRRESAERLHADHTAVQSGLALAAKAGVGLHSHAPAHDSGKYGVLLRLGLLLEQIHAGHADHADVNALSGQDFLGLHGQGHLGAAGDQDGVRGLLAAVLEHVAAL